MSPSAAATILALTPNHHYTPTSLKAQYRAQALLYHPDKNPGKEQEMTERFKLVGAAWEVLQKVGPEGFVLEREEYVPQMDHGKLTNEQARQKRKMERAARREAAEEKERLRKRKKEKVDKREEDCFKAEEDFWA